MISFFVPLIPKGQARARSRAVNIGGSYRAMTYKSKEGRLAEAKFLECARDYAPSVPYTGPLELEIYAWFPIPTSYTTKKRSEIFLNSYAHTTKPDLDNIIKLVKDSLNGLFWVDDKQIYKVIASKRYTKANLPGYQISIYEGGT